MGAPVCISSLVGLLGGKLPLKDVHIIGGTVQWELLEPLRCPGWRTLEATRGAGLCPISVTDAFPMQTQKVVWTCNRYVFVGVLNLFSWVLFVECSQFISAYRLKTLRQSVAFLCWIFKLAAECKWAALGDLHSDFIRQFTAHPPISYC